MSAWDTYQNRIKIYGDTKRKASLIRETRFIESKLPDNLSYHSVDIYPAQYGYNIKSDNAIEHLIHQNVAIINSDNLNEKTIISMPYEGIELGSLINWMGNYWLVCERDANTTVYEKGKLLQCNHLLKWISPEKEIMEQWCIIEDGTKYLTGELEDKNFVVTRGDSRISLQIARNKYTVAFGRECRFLIDDTDSPHKLSYLLTKPLKLGQTYNDEGTFKFVLQEVTATSDDNHELGIADYYKYFPKGTDDDSVVTELNIGNGESSKRKVWL